MIEHADTQGGQVPWTSRRSGVGPTRPTTPDLNNRPRFATARKALP